MTEAAAQVPGGEHDDHDEHDYAGPATIVLADAEIAVEVTLRGHFQPIDGYYHWYGRIAANDELAAALTGRKVEARIRTPHGEAGAKLTDPDPWQRYRITGTSTPPFPVYAGQP